MRNLLVNTVRANISRINAGADAASAERALLASGILDDGPKIVTVDGETYVVQLVSHTGLGGFRSVTYTRAEVV